MTDIDYGALLASFAEITGVDDEKAMKCLEVRRNKLFLSMCGTSASLNDSYVHAVGLSPIPVFFTTY